MHTVNNGSRVQLHYRGTLKDGTEFEDTSDGEPLEVTVGEGQVVAAVDQALVGMLVGEIKTLTLAPHEAFGPHMADRIYSVARDQVPEDVELEIGRTLVGRGRDENEIIMRVLAFDDETVTVDGNHPLAGKDVTFELTIVDIV